MTPFYSVAVVFSKDKKKILLGKRREDKLWTSPAGGGEEGESPKACIIRELFEEANISCKESDLKFLTSLTAKNNKPIFIFTMCMDSKQNIHVKNDPDKEVPSWNWYPLDAMPKLEENRQKTVNMAKMKMKDLIKSIVSTDMHSGVDLHTEDFSQDDMAARDSDWYNKITALMYDSEVNEPQTIQLENGFEMSIQRIHEGLYSGSIKDENQDRALNFAELSIPSLVQTLKAKEFIDKDSKIEEMAQPVETPPEGDSDVKVEAPGLESLADLVNTLKQINVEGDLNITIQKSVTNLLQNLLRKSGPTRGKRGFPVGTQRTWSNGVKAVKHADGWVVLGGKHHGKLVGKFKEDVQEHHLEVATTHLRENTDKEVQGIHAQIKQLKEAHDKKQQQIKDDHDKLMIELKEKHASATKRVEESKARLKQLGAKLGEKGKGSKKKPENSKEGTGSNPKKEEAGTKGTREEPEPGRKEDNKQGTSGDTKPEGSVGASSGEDKQPDVERKTEEVNKPQYSLNELTRDVLADENGRKYRGFSTGLESKVPYKSPEGTDTNMIGHVAFGKSSKAMQEKLNQNLQNAEIILDDLGVKFKTPIDFVCQSMKATANESASYNPMEGFDVNHRIDIRHDTAIQKSLMHEIGHALDYSTGPTEKKAITDKSKYLSHSVLEAGQSKELEADMKKLAELADQSTYYQENSKGKFGGYLRVKTEIFARGFEVLTYKRAEKLIESGKLKPEALDHFTPDFIKASKSAVPKEMIKEFPEVKAANDLLEAKRAEIKEDRIEYYVAVEEKDMPKQLEQMSKIRSKAATAKKLDAKYRKAYRKASSKMRADTKVEDADQILNDVAETMERIISKSEMKKAMAVLQLRKLINSFGTQNN